MLYPKQHSQRSKSNINIFSKSMLSPDRLENKRKCLIEKFTIALKLKHAKLFKERGYSVQMLTNDLNEMIKAHELDNFNYNAYMFRLDQDILNKVLPMPIVSSSRPISNTSRNLPEMKMTEGKNKTNNSGLGSKNHSNNVNLLKINLEKNNTDLLLEDPLNQQLFSQKNQRLVELRLKEQDEWGKMAKQNFLNFQQEKNEKKQKVKEKNLELVETLQKQAQEKRERDSHVNSDLYYLNMQNNINQKYDDQEKNKMQRMKEKYKEIELERQNFVSVKKRQDLELQEKEKNLDKKYIENNKADLQKEKERFIRKKEAERSHFQQTYENNNLRNQLMNEDKMKEKLENERIERENKELRDKQDKDRENFFSSIKEKFKRNAEVTSYNVIQDKIMREMESQRLIKEIEEKEYRAKINDMRKKEKIQDLKKEMNEVLAIQVEKKKKLQENEKEIDKVIGSQLVHQAEILKEEKMKQQSKKDEIKYLYKKDLDQQLNQKIINKLKTQEDPYKQKHVNSYVDFLEEEQDKKAKEMN